MTKPLRPKTKKPQQSSAATRTPDEVSQIVAAVFVRQSCGHSSSGYETALQLVQESIQDFAWSKSTWHRDFKSYVTSVKENTTFLLSRFRHGGKRESAGRPQIHATAEVARETKHGGKRESAGRPQIHATAEVAREAKKRAYTDLRRKRKEIEYLAEPERVSTGYFAYLIDPCVVNIAEPCSELGVDMGVLLAACKCAFENHHCAEGADDGGLIFDYYDPKRGHTGSGQMRRVVNSAPKLAKREFAKKNYKYSANALWIKSSFLDAWLASPVSASLEAIQQVAIAAIKSRCHVLGLRVLDGFPRLLELEFIYTPPGAPQQLPHADTRLNVITAMSSLTAKERLGHVGKSTFYAQNFKDVFDEEHWDDMREYTYKQFTLPTRVPSMTISHGAWPHHGPGNLSKKRGRYTLFMSFAMDEAATYFSTSEKVHRYTVSGTPDEEEMH